MEPHEIALSVQLTRNGERLAYNLQRMRQSLKTFAEHLADVRSSGCWKVRDDPYCSFADFCRKELNISESRASQIISAGGTLHSLSEAASTPEERVLVESLSEGAVTVLKGVEPEKAFKILKTAAKEGKITASKLTHHLGTKVQPKVKICPHCGHSLS
jgi:hypothetical protein